MKFQGCDLSMVGCDMKCSVGEVSFVCSSSVLIVLLVSIVMLLSTLGAQASNSDCT